MERSRHYCKACGRKKEAPHMYRMRVTVVGIEFWLCELCVLEGGIDLITTQRPSTSYDIDKILGRR